MQFVDEMEPLADLHITRHLMNECPETKPKHEADAQFTEPEWMGGLLIHESAAFESWTRVAGVRGAISCYISATSHLNFRKTFRKASEFEKLFG